MLVAKPIHTVSAWSVESSLVLGQLCVDEKTNEILLDILCLEGCIVTIDAMGTQKEIAKKIIQKNADYILQVKGNQQTFMNDIVSIMKKMYLRKRKIPWNRRGVTIKIFAENMEG